MTYQEDFIANLQKNGRVQVPVLIRWKNKLDAGEIQYIRARNPEGGYNEIFHTRLSRDGCFTIPKIVIERIKVKLGDVLEVTLFLDDIT